MDGREVGGEGVEWIILFMRWAMVLW